MDRIRIQIAADGSSAEACATPGVGGSADDVQAALARAGVRSGIDAAAVTEFARRLGDPGFDGSLVVARGTAPEPGADGRVACAIDTRFLPGREHGDGHIDYRERGRLHPVAAEQPLGEIVAPTPGTPGRDVRGRELAARPGRAHTLRLGPGVRTDGARLVAARAGVLLHDTRQLDVVPLYSHTGDVDLHSGNLHSEGSLEVRGDVRQGFAVTAGGDVVVGGVVQGGTVTAGGSATIAQGVLGRDAVVQAGAAIACRHATSARLCAGAAIEIGDHATQCTLSGERVHATSGRGTIVGGETRARHAIRLVHAGAESGAATLLAVGDLTGEQAELVRRGNLGAQLERQAVRARRDGGGGKARRAALRSADTARDERLQLAQRQRELLRSASIEVAGTAHAGVRLRFGAFTRQLDEPRSRTRFTWNADRDDIHEEPLS